MHNRLNNLQRALVAYHLENNLCPEDAESFPTVLDLLDVRDAALVISLPRGAVLLRDVFVALLPGYISQWRQSRETTLLSLLSGLPTHSQSAQAVSSCTIATRSSVPGQCPLNHPAALFWCDACRSIITASVAMRHTCCYGRADHDCSEILEKLFWCMDGAYSRPVVVGEQLFEKTLLGFCKGLLPWSHKSLRGCVNVVTSIFEACGANLLLGDTTTDKQLRRTRIVCKTCSQMGICVLAMGWRRAVSGIVLCAHAICNLALPQVAHAFDVHDGANVSWAKAHLKIEDKVKSVEYNSRKLTAAATEVCARWSCLLCSWPENAIAYSWPLLNGHVQTK